MVIYAVIEVGAIVPVKQQKRQLAFKYSTLTTVYFASNKTSIDTPDSKTLARFSLDWLQAGILVLY